MIKLENEDVFGFSSAIRGMRNPMNSWEKSDSHWKEREKSDYEFGAFLPTDYVVGENDLKLMRQLSKAGNDHAKFLRMINVTVDITAPLYWWKEFDTYKVGTVANSCSTMHKIQEKIFELSDFSCEHLHDEAYDSLIGTIYTLNEFRRRFKQHGDKEDWWQMIQLLPSSYNQRRTVQLNYQVLKAIYHARKNHKLDEWREFCKWCETLPYFKEICIQD